MVVLCILAYVCRLFRAQEWDIFMLLMLLTYLISDQGTNPDKMNPGRKAPINFCLLVDGKLHLNQTFHYIIMEILKWPWSQILHRQVKVVF